MKLSKSFPALVGILSFFLICSFTLVEKETTIVVIDGKALLVDVDENGKILTTYMEVPEYFMNEKDHASKVLEAKKHYVRLSAAQMDQIRFIALAEEGYNLDEFMVSNIADLATHYHQTYANQISITAAKNQRNESLLDQNLEKITNLLASYGVDKRDIIVDFKKDMGDEPTQFIKVVSNFRKLSSL